MNEEMRKEFEKWFSSYCDERGFNYRFETLLNGEYASWPEHNAFLGWQASREAMKPIRLPDDVDTTQCKTIEKEIFYDGINYGIKKCKDAIEQAGYNVVP